ncbi:MAG: peptidoglycan DD-metalloendopeptidase family protein [Anaerolineae bacterium]|nr:peptidoglycan DD-metalloendopeptidase family protein [Anaerolineae bacterium]
MIVLIEFGLLIHTLFFPPAPITSAQPETAPCGYVDGFDFPVPGIDLEHNDFGIYRARFGGLHTGIDVAFEQLGAPVRAAARGRVTYSDTAGWDTEKGVVVIQHTFPDGTLINTLYGHMEELNDYNFPAMNQCVELGDIIGAVGAPSLGLPHLHYEVRTRYRHEGGPGYTDVNPLELGWLHPLDFTYLARVWIHPAHRAHFSLAQGATLPPLLLSNSGYVITQSTQLVGLSAEGNNLWQFDTLGSVTGVLELPDGRVLSGTSANQVLILDDGSYSALWEASKTLVTPPELLGEAVIFITADDTLIALTPDGVPLWETGALPGHATQWAVGRDRVAIATDSGHLWIVDSEGHVIYMGTYPDVPVPFVGSSSDFYVLSDSAILRIDQALTVSPPLDTGLELKPGAELIHHAGVFYLYTGEGRSLYAYGVDGALLWIAYMPGSHLHAPRLGIGGGQIIYVLTTDGQLLAYGVEDGRLVAQLALYDGGIDGTTTARWLDVGPDDTVRFSGGYLSVVTLDGLALMTDEN